MILTNAKFDITKAMLNNPDLYSRVAKYELMFMDILDDMSDENLKKNPAAVSLGVIVYAEYYGSKRVEPDAIRKERFTRLIKAYVENVPDLVFTCGDTKETIQFSGFSPAALDFMFQYDACHYFISIGSDCTLTPAALYRIVSCSTPDEIVLTWTNMLSNPKGLSEKATFTGLSVQKHFEKQCLGAIEVPNRLVREAQLTSLGKGLFNVLENTNHDYTLLRRAFIKTVVSTAKDSIPALKSIVSSVLTNGQIPKDKILFDFVTVLDHKSFENCAPIFKIHFNDDSLMTMLNTETQQPLEEKKQLLRLSSSILTDDQLFDLAKMYAKTDWSMFREIMVQANPPKRNLDNMAWFIQTERQFTTMHNASWPVSFSKLDAIISQYEASIAPKEGSAYTRLLSSVPELNMNTLKNIPTMATVNATISTIAAAPGVITGHSSPRDALAELYPLFEKGTALPEKAANSLLGLFITQWKKDYPDAKELSLESLPVTLRERLETLKAGVMVPVQPAVNPAKSALNNLSKLM